MPMIFEAAGPPLVSRWSAAGLPLVSRWSAAGQSLVRRWSAAGPPLISHWPAAGPQLVRSWSATGPPLVNSWSAAGKPLVSGKYRLEKKSIIPEIPNLRKSTEDDSDVEEPVDTEYQDQSGANFTLKDLGDAWDRTLIKKYPGIQHEADMNKRNWKKDLVQDSDEEKQNWKEDLVQDSDKEKQNW
ncbi:Protein CBG26251 [Caenorhabditis briggsae]|uniref:Protein CBG26251 n=1 Tax=Caenorhabditis briggsae TaxID=6238 RepID=B6ILX2_CAEBR|nr:Protein CBG26251 [Caenorhabditis briggsae]CAS00902.1 Protein CBG26251 [Caenorhabditis briggsae]